MVLARYVQTAVIASIFCAAGLAEAEAEDWSPAWQALVYEEYCGLERHFDLAKYFPSTDPENKKQIQNATFSFNVYLSKERVPEAFGALGVVPKSYVFSVQLFERPAREVPYSVTLGGFKAKQLIGELNDIYFLTNDAAAQVFEKLDRNQAVALITRDEFDNVRSLDLDESLFSVASRMFLACIEAQSANGQP